MNAQRPRDVIQAALERQNGDATAQLLTVELLCDIRDLLSECAVRLSDIESYLARAD